MYIAINLLALYLLLEKTVWRNQIIDFENRVGALMQIVTDNWLLNIIKYYSIILNTGKVTIYWLLFEFILLISLIKIAPFHPVWTNRWSHSGFCLQLVLASLSVLLQCQCPSFDISIVNYLVSIYDTVQFGYAYFQVVWHLIFIYKGSSCKSLKFFFIFFNQCIIK